MYVCMCVMYVYIYIMYDFNSVCMYACLHACLPCLLACLHVYVCMYACMHVRMFAVLLTSVNLLNYVEYTNRGCRNYLVDRCVPAPR